MLIPTVKSEGKIKHSITILLYFKMRFYYWQTYIVDDIVMHIIIWMPTSIVKVGPSWLCSCGIWNYNYLC